MGMDSVRQRRGVSLVGLVVTLAITALLAAVTVATFAPHRTNGVRGVGGGHVVGATGGTSVRASFSTRADVASLTTTAHSLATEAEALAEATQALSSAMDPATPGHTYVQVAAGDLRTGARLVEVSPEAYQLSDRAGVVCLRFPATSPGAAMVHVGSC